MATCSVETVIVDLKDDMATGCFDIIQVGSCCAHCFDTGQGALSTGNMR